MAHRIFYCDETERFNCLGSDGCTTIANGGCYSRIYYIKESDHEEELENLRENLGNFAGKLHAKNSEIAAKDSEIQNLKSKMSQSEMKAKEELDNIRENLGNFAGKLYAEKDFADVKIVCNEKTFACHKAVLSCQSKVFKTMIRNKSLTEKQAEVMEINENDFNSEWSKFSSIFTMEVFRTLK